MPPGPILIFDKSTLESLNPDESAWLDNFFLTNITPLFFAETLADLEKQVHVGRTPEAVVGNIAQKTPDLQSSPAAHHLKLLGSDLYGTETVLMDSRILRAGGKESAPEQSWPRQSRTSLRHQGRCLCAVIRRRIGCRSSEHYGIMLTQQSQESLPVWII
jgi:hypothetical protein